jgi:hypothetical protein
MRDFKELAQQAWNHYQSQPGIVSISIDGNPPSGLRYGFASESAAERFLSFRELHNSYEPVHANTLRQDGADVVEVWR